MRRFDSAAPCAQLSDQPGTKDAECFAVVARRAHVALSPGCQPCSRHPSVLRFPPIFASASTLRCGALPLSSLPLRHRRAAHPAAAARHRSTVREQASQRACAAWLAARRATRTSLADMDAMGVGEGEGGGREVRAGVVDAEQERATWMGAEVRRAAAPPTSARAAAVPASRAKRATAAAERHARRALSDSDAPCPRSALASSLSGRHAAAQPAWSIGSSQRRGRSSTQPQSGRRQPQRIKRDARKGDDAAADAAGAAAAEPPASASAAGCRRVPSTPRFCSGTQRSGPAHRRPLLHAAPHSDCANKLSRTGEPDSPLRRC
jgi:hypothetical protein